MRVAVLFSELSGYMRACLAALRRHGARVLVVHYPVVADAPFDADAEAWADEIVPRLGTPLTALRARVAAFAPDGLLISGWMDRDYLRIAREWRRRGVPVVAGTDTPWRGTLRQYAAGWIAPWLLHPAIDTLWVAGERQRTLARRLGYAGDRCLNGFYACDWDRFAAAGRHRRDETRAFLFVGRYDPAKGVPTLLEAYAAYRARHVDPWPLLCAGAGPLKPLLAGRDGVEDRGFVQPAELPDLLAQASAFVLPSRYEPWGVAIQEAAAAGLPLLCSSACGATAHLLIDGYNGYLVEPDDTEHLATQLTRLHTLPAGTRHAMGERSREMSLPFTPDRWADTLLEGLSLRSAGADHPPARGAHRRGAEPLSVNT
jgi:glycosyltransferase involved in cell wall biosynthesis